MYVNAVLTCKEKKITNVTLCETGNDSADDLKSSNTIRFFKKIILEQLFCNSYYDRLGSCTFVLSLQPCHQRVAALKWQCKSSILRFCFHVCHQNCSETTESGGKQGHSTYSWGHLQNHHYIVTVIREWIVSCEFCEYCSHWWAVSSCMIKERKTKDCLESVPKEYMQYRDEFLKMLQRYRRMRDGYFGSLLTVKHTVNLKAPSTRGTHLVPYRVVPKAVMVKNRRSTTCWRWVS